MKTFLPSSAWRPLITGRKKVRVGVRTRLGGRSLPCRGPEAPQSALAAVSSKSARFVNAAERVARSCRNVSRGRRASIRRRATSPSYALACRAAHRRVHPSSAPSRTAARCHRDLRSAFRTPTGSLLAMPDLGSLVAVVLKGKLGVADTDPDPALGISLITFTPEDADAVTRDRGNDPRILPINLEARHVHVVADAGSKASNPENRGDTFKHRCGRFW